MREITAARAIPDTLLVHIEDELIVSAHVYIKVLRSTRDLDNFSEVKHDFVSLRSMRRRDPFRLPELGPSLRRILWPDFRNVAKNNNKDDKQNHRLFSHGRNRTSARNLSVGLRSFTAHETDGTPITSLTVTREEGVSSLARRCGQFNVVSGFLQGLNSARVHQVKSRFVLAPGDVIVAGFCNRYFLYVLPII